MILRKHGVATALAVHGDGAERGGVHAGDLSDFSEHLAIYLDDPFRLGLVLRRHAEAKSQYRFRIAESRVNLCQRAECPDHQARADQQNQGQGDLHNDQDASGAVAFASGTGAAPTVAEAGADSTRSRIFVDGDEAETGAGDERHQYGEDEDGRVDGDLVEAWQSCRGKVDEPFQSRPCKGQTERAACESKQHTFGEQFTRQAAAAGTERGADGELMLAAFGAH